MDYQAVIVGGGLAGLTTAAYLVRSNIRVLLCEKTQQVGGLVNTFERGGFVFDGGIRAIENSGIVRPMLSQLGIDLPFLANPVSIGIGDDVVRLEGPESLVDYLALLSRQFPDQSAEISRFGQEMRKIMKYMDILYGIDNPIFLDMQKDRDYFLKTILPWLFKYLVTIGKIDKLERPVVGYLQEIMSSRSLVDLIAQHFFKGTPTFFALSYFSLYLDYSYPRGGTGRLAERLRQYIVEHGGEIRYGTEISRIDIDGRRVIDTQGHEWNYGRLVWAADLKRLYQVIDDRSVGHVRTQRAIAARRAELADLAGGDSILTLFLAVDREPQAFGDVASAHFFYTPEKLGLGALAASAPAIIATDEPAAAVPRTDNGASGSAPAYTTNREVLKAWLRRYLELTTYEISCPALRDASLAPAGQTGLIVSTLFDYPLAAHIEKIGWYDDFKALCAEVMIEVLDRGIYPGLREKVIDAVVATPLTLQRQTGNTDGAITGWAFTNGTMPVIHTMKKITRSVLTGLPDVYQAGQWVFSPSGLPISIMTGKLAADRIIRDLK
jgi:phytoene dehydrogenase-like protein